MAKKRKTVRLDLDVAPAAAGFGSASAPTPAHHRIMKHFASPFLLGPPPSEDLLALMMHMFTAEEAEVAQHLPPLRPRTAEKVAAVARRPLDEVEPVLDHLAYTKAVILGHGKKVRRYTLLPLVPGTFEMTLITADLATRNAWHQRFAELFERVYDTGYLADYTRRGRTVMRVLPVNSLAGSLQGAWPVERLEELFEGHKRFAIGQCQCRMAMRLVGKGCDRPLTNCLAFGPMAKPAIARGMMREVSRQTAIDAKREAEAAGCVTWIGNVRQDWRGNASCSCCGCCCHALRMINDFDAPALIAPPHFMPVRDETCHPCRLCAEACPTGAWTYTKEDKRLDFNPRRCVGCGLCVLACPRGSLQLEPAAGRHATDETWPSLIYKGLPSALLGTTGVWIRRLLG